MYENYSVLFVDDEVNVLNSLKRGLIEEEYTCYFASSGKDALELLSKEKVSVIVSDMRMPEMDGLKLLKEVETRYPHIIKIVLSGYTQLQQILTTINQVDIFKFITKPWKLESEFKSVINKALNYYIIQEENEEMKTILQNKNQAYINILKNIDETIALAKNSCDILGECCKQIMVFNRQACSQPKEVYDNLLLLQERVIDLFTFAVKGDVKEISSETLFKDILQGIENYISIVKADIKSGYSQYMKMYHRIALALMLSSAMILEEYSKQKGGYLVAAVNEFNAPTISLICPQNSMRQSDDEQNEGKDLNIKLDLLNSVMSKVADKGKMEFHVTILNDSIITVLTLNAV